MQIFLLSLFVTPRNAHAQNISNAGSEFWSVFPTHEADNNSLANYSIFITGSQASSGVITAGSFSKAFTVAANAVTEVQVPRANAYINDTEGNTLLANRAIHLVVDAGKPKVVVYAHIFAGRRSAASLILPKEALGQQYFGMTYTQDDAGQNYITIVATEPNTKVHLRKGKTELVAGGITLNNVNDVYEYLSPTDLTGVSVTVDTLASGCNSFAVFSGSSGLRIGTSSCTPQSIDPLFQQCYPVTSWGKNYGFVPFSMQSPNFTNPVRTAGQFARVLAREDGTVVNINGSVAATLNSGEFYTTPQPLQTAAYISANKPVSVAQYALTQSCSNLNQTDQGYSDPDMVILNPIEYNINNITVYSSTRENISEQYVNILIKTTAAASFRINGYAPAGVFVPMAVLPGYSYLQLSLKNFNTNTFTLTAAEGFNAIAYGFGNVESYSYSAGTNLAATETISAILSGTQQAVDSTCVKDDYFFRLTLPYQPTQISWQLDATETPVVQINPVGTLVLSQGINYYSYAFPKSKAYQNAGKHIIKVLAQYPAAIGGCSKGQDQINYAFTVIPVPVVNFKAAAEKCHNMIDFTDLTPNTNQNIVNRVWDFGDGQTDVNANPVHSYGKPGTYVVKLSTSFTTGCQDFKLDTITISQKTLPGFSFSDQDCAGKAITFADTSKTTDFAIGLWKWNFGDGDTLVVNNGSAFQHVFKKAGTYQVSLTLVNTEGCVAAAYVKTIVVHNNPVPDFKLPAVCLNDQLAQFTDLTTIADSLTEQPLTYLWNFGDPNASALNPNTSTLKNPVHRYPGQGNYPVTLTVTTVNGCSATAGKTFTVNGAKPAASFKLQNTQVCSNDQVIVQNLSSVDFGTITRIEWHFDEPGHPDSAETYNNPKPGQLYNHRYPAFHTPASKTYTIRLLAYSGTLCAADTSKTVTLLAVPQVAFDSLAKVCLSANVFKIVQGHETAGITGTGSYSGDGTLADGTFNPAKAGAGVHAIQYKYTSASGCSDSLRRQITVVTDPTVNAGDDIRILQGEQAALNIKTTGGALTYKWTPAAGLDHDDIPNPIASPQQDITYTVTVSNGTCLAYDDVHITVIPPLFIPNTFTPNADGNNDTWNIKNLNYYYPNATVEIFTRTGRKIFSSVGYGVPWNGQYKGHDMPPDTYYYIIDLNNGKKKLASWLQLIK